MERSSIVSTAQATAATTRPLLTGDQIDAALHALIDQLDRELGEASEALEDYKEQIADDSRDPGSCWDAAHNLRAWVHSTHDTTETLATMTIALLNLERDHS